MADRSTIRISPLTDKQLLRHKKKMNHVINDETWKNVPESEVDFMEEVTGMKKERESVKMDIACGRKDNKICENCGYKDNTKLLKACSKCRLLYYCSKTCQRSHWHSGHNKRCCNLNAPREMGYSRTVLTNPNTGEMIR